MFAQTAAVLDYLVGDYKFVSCAQILGNNECFEPYTSNIYVRRVLSGEFTVVNQHLLQDLTRLGLWNRELKHEQDPRQCQRLGPGQSYSSCPGRRLGFSFCKSKCFAGLDPGGPVEPGLKDEPVKANG